MACPGAGWLDPAARAGGDPVPAWFELVNVEDRLVFLAGGEVPAPFELGSLRTAWARLAEARTTTELRVGLAGSAWGDPGSDDPADMRLALRFGWARRVQEAVGEAADWAAGAVALVVARELFLAGRSADDLLVRRPPGIGVAWARAGSLSALRDALPEQAAWPLRDVSEPVELWRAELAWWRRVADDADGLVHAPLMGEPMVIGVVVALGVDAWRASAALEVAARGGRSKPLEVFDEIA